MSQIQYYCVKCRNSRLSLENDHFECPSCGACFALKEGIPVFLTEETDEYLFQKEIKDWDQNTNFYNQEIKSSLFNIVHRAKLDTYAPFIKQSCTYLDLGAGNGFFSEELRRKFKVKDIYVMDFSMGMNISAKKIFSLPNVLCASSSQIPFEDASFDGIFTNGALHHFKVQESWDKTLGEIDRILKPGGYIFIFDRHDSFGGKQLHHLALFLRKILKSLKEDIATSASDNEPDFSLEDLDSLTSKGYLVSKRTFPTNIFLFFMVLLCNAIEYTVNFRVSQFCRNFLNPAAKASQCLNYSFLAVEQCIVLQKPPHHN